MEVEPLDLEPLSPDEVRRALTDDASRHRFVRLAIVLEFCRHPSVEAQADLVERYAAALGVDEQMQTVARDAARDDREHLAADWARFREATEVEAQLVDAPLDELLAAQLRGLAGCPADSLGRAYFDFYDGAGLAFPGEPGGGDLALVSHDFTHVLADYGPTPVDEVALQAMLTSATDGEHHFSGFIASLGLFESGMLEFPDIVPKSEVLDRPGAAAEIADTIRRGRGLRRRLRGRRPPGAGGRATGVGARRPRHPAAPPCDLSAHRGDLDGVPPKPIDVFPLRPPDGWTRLTP